MQKFILIRGHQGSGKTTLAKQKIADFNHQYPDADIIHLENDILLTDEQGHYHWTPERVDKAQLQNLATFKQKLQYGQQHPYQDMLIINSNTNQKASNCLHLIKMAKNSGFTVEIYRLHNFFDNLHRVDITNVLSAYINLNNNPLANEIHIQPIQMIDEKTRQILERMQQSKS